MVTPVHADLQMPSIIGSRMVLQQNTDDALWGWDTPGTTVSVTFRGQQRVATAGGDGKWAVRMPGGAAGGPFTLQIQGTTQATLSDVLVGEVWVAGGQSNMWWHVGNCTNAPLEIADAAHDPGVRYWDANTSPTQGGWPAETPQKTVPAEWKVTSPQTVADFAGVPYFFAKELHRRLGVPVGIVHLAVPGVDIETMLSPEFARASLPQAAALRELQRRTYPEDKKHYEAAHAAWESEKAALKPGEKSPAEPQAPADPSAPYAGAFYSGMVVPAAPYTTRGFLWWQGENNAERFLQYRELFPALIQEWRHLWGADDAPFLFVELANFLPVQTKPIEDAPWPDLRDAQRAALRLPQTYEISAIDILGRQEDPFAIHPPHKQLAGHRLFLAALASVYGDHSLVWSGPTFDGVTFHNAQATVSFGHIGTGLVLRPDPSGRSGFALAGSDRQFHWARAENVGATVVLHCPEVPYPIAVRYAWANNPIVTLYNKEGLPAFPFRSDDWILGLAD